MRKSTVGYRNALIYLNQQTATANELQIRQHERNKMRKRIINIIMAAILSSAMITGCASSAVKGTEGTETVSGDDSETVSDTGNGQTSGTYTSASSGGASTTDGVNVKLTGDYSDKALDASWSEADADAVITLNGDSITVNGDGASASGSTLTITDSGTYVIKGTLDDGQIIVNNKDDKNVRLVFDGADITCSTGSPVEADAAKNLYITLADGTVNNITDSRSASDTDDEDKADAAVYSECDLIINGTGTLNVTGGYSDGIKSKDDLQIISGIINVKAYDDGITGKDSVEIKDGTINITCADDGIKSSEDDDPEKGYIVVDGGSITVSSDGGHGFQATYVFVMNDGAVNVTKCNEGIESLNIVQNGGDITINAADDGLNVSDKRAASDGNDAETENSGTDTADTGDGSGSVTVQNMTYDSSDDAETEETAFGKGSGRGENMPGAVSGNNADMGHGPQMQKGTMSGNSAGMPQGGPGGGQGGMNGGQGGMGGSMENCDGCLVINGGTLTVTASGDGLDSNGDILITGGTVTVYGPAGDGDTAIDKNGVWEQDGGTVYAQGSSGMVEAVDADISSGCYVSTVFSSAVAAGTEITVTDSDGNTVMSFTSKESVPFVYFSSPDLKEGAAYTITAGSQSVTVTEGEMSTGNMGGGSGGR